MAPYPANAGTLNVKDFGAVGDGIHDDTQAFVAALAATSDPVAFWHVRIVSVPAGVYRITDTISKRYPNGNYDAGFVLVGAGRDQTILRVDNSAAGFQDPAHPKAVLYLSGKGVAQSPTIQGQNGYLTEGAGNDGFSNFIENLTVDTGVGNPGAVGIDAVISNQGAIRSVAVTGDGVAGISMLRPWMGPALVENVAISGFDVGIDIANLVYSVTMENVALTGQRSVGLRNADNLVAIHGLTIDTTGNPTEQAIVNTTSSGMLVIDAATISTTAPAGIVLANNGLVQIRGLKIPGYTNFLGKSVTTGHVIDGVYNGIVRLSGAKPGWAQSWQPAPLPPVDPLPAWINVADFGAKGDGVTDDTASLKAAFASGASTIYLPFGLYVLSGNIDIPPTVNRIEGMNSTLLSSPMPPHTGFYNASAGLLVSHNTATPLLIEKLFMLRAGGPMIAIEHAGTAPLVLADIVGMGVAFNRDATAGLLHMTDISGGFLLNLAGAAPVQGVQIDTEGGPGRGGTIPYVRITNNGAPLWLLGLKSEGANTLVATSNYGSTDILGVVFAPIVLPTVPLFTTMNAHFQAAGAEIAFTTEGYQAILQNSTPGKEGTLMAGALPLRPAMNGVFLRRLLP